MNRGSKFTHIKCALYDKKKDQIIFPLNEDILGNEKGSIVLITMIGQQDKYLLKTEMKDESKVTGTSLVVQWSSG